jgi:phosphatidylglycerol:prolipoprotein diacylglycerol transferase
MYPELIHIGSFTVYSWGFTLAVAVIISIIGIQKRFARSGLPKEWGLDIVIILTVGGVVGARLFYVLLYQRDVFLHNPAQLLTLGPSFSGLIWYGGVVGALIPFIVYLKLKKLSFFKATDILAPFIALSYAVVRIGCFMAGCCYGEKTIAHWGVIFPVVDQSFRYPTQLYSSALNFLLFLLLIWLYPRRKFDGQVFIVYLLGYSVYRFIVEFYRENLITFGAFSLGHIVTFILFALAVGMYYRFGRRTRHL